MRVYFSLSLSLSLSLCTMFMYMITCNVCVYCTFGLLCVFFCSDSQETLDPISGIAASEQLLIAVS